MRADNRRLRPVGRLIMAGRILSRQAGRQGTVRSVGRSDGRTEQLGEHVGNRLEGRRRRLDSSPPAPAHVPTKRDKPDRRGRTDGADISHGTNRLSIGWRKKRSQPDRPPLPWARTLEEGKSGRSAGLEKNATVCRACASVRPSASAIALSPVRRSDRSGLAGRDGYRSVGRSVGRRDLASVRGRMSLSSPLAVHGGKGEASGSKARQGKAREGKGRRAAGERASARSPHAMHSL